MSVLRTWSSPLLISLISLAAYGGMVSMQFRHGNLGTTQVGEFLKWYALAFAAYAAALFWLERWWLGKRGGPNGSGTGIWNVSMLLWIWGGGLLFRWMLLQTFPTLSSDVFRYMWDGHVTVNGISPYAYPIEASQLDWLDVPFRSQANHAWMASPYMPAAQWFFAIIANFYPLDAFSFQVSAVLFDLGTAFTVSRLLSFAGMPSHRLFIYLWNPLVIVETAQGAHLDALMVLLTILAVYALLRIGGTRGRTAKVTHGGAHGGSPVFSLLSPTLLALATLTKLIPVLLAPILWWRWNWGSRLLYVYLTLGMLVSPALRAGWGLTGEMDGRGLFGALRIYDAQWKFNSGLFRWLEIWLEDMGIGEAMSQAQEITYFLLVVLLIGAWLLSRNDNFDPKATLRWIAVPICGYLLLSTTIHPWYLLVLIPFLPFLAPADDEPKHTWLMPLPWLWLSGIVALSYITYLDPGNVRDLHWVRLVEWVPTLLLIGIALVWAVRKRGGIAGVMSQARPDDVVGPKEIT